MSFVNLNIIAYANGYTRWHFGTNDSLDQILEPGYFPSHCGIRRGDRIDALTPDSTAELLAVDGMNYGNIRRPIRVIEIWRHSLD